MLHLLSCPCPTVLHARRREQDSSCSLNSTTHHHQQLSTQLSTDKHQHAFPSCSSCTCSSALSADAKVSPSLAAAAARVTVLCYVYGIYANYSGYNISFMRADFKGRCGFADIARCRCRMEREGVLVLVMGLDNATNYSTVEMLLYNSSSSTDAAFPLLCADMSCMIS